MNTKDENTHEDEMLKEAYEQIAPVDSWDALRERIGNRLAESQVNLIPHENHTTLRFWKRLSFAMAAGFIVTAGILIYTIGLNQGANPSGQQTVSAYSGKLVGQDDVNTLVDAFSQVRKLFGDQSRWIVIGSSNESQVGLTESPQTDPDTQKLVVVRLALSSDAQRSQQRYYDIVTYADQKTKLQLPLENATALILNLKPVIGNDGTISVEIDANVNGASQSMSKCTIANESFTPLVNMRVNGDWIRIDGVGRQISADGKMML